jgi:sugar phosphate isomerase/epimerase
MTQPDWEDWVKKQKEVADSLNIKWGQGHAHFFGWNGLSKDEWEWNDELVRRSIVGAGIMGVKWLVVHPGNAFDGALHSYRKSLASNIEKYKEYAEIASKHNVNIAIENMIENKIGRRYASSADELVELHDALNDPLFGICWDTGHANLNGVDQVESLRLIGKRLRALHINDNWGEKDDHLAPYFGSIKWEPILDVLNEIRYEGDFAFEIHNFMNGLPDGLHDQALEFTRQLGEFMIRR